MTKDEILWLTPTIEHCGAKWHGRIGVEMAMDEYAKQEAIAFKKWSDSFYIETGHDGNEAEYSHVSGENDERFTTSELYEKYQQSKTQ